MESEALDMDTAVQAPLKESCWYQPSGSGGRYWHINSIGRWIHKNCTQFTRWCQTQGLTDYIPDSEKGTRVLTPIEDLMTELETERIIDYAGGLAGWESGVHEVSSGRILVTQSPDLITPCAPDKVPDGAAMWDFEAHGWPVIGNFLTGLCNGTEYDDGKEESIEQLPHLITWLWHFMESLYAGKYSTGLTLALAGEPECGKTLLASLVQTMSGGVVARPYRYMVGQDNFNEEWLEATLLLVDDENSDTHIQSRLKFGSEMKQITASRGTRIRAMHQKALLLQPIQRLMICVNKEPERLQVLPPIDNDIRDKILILKGYSKPMPMAARTFYEQEKFWGVLLAELPHFIHWLLRIYEPDINNLGRFGPKAWQHPEILEELGKLSPESRTHEFIERFLNKRQPRLYEKSLDHMSMSDRGRMKPYVARDGGWSGWVGTVAELRSSLVADGDEACLSLLEKREVRAAAYLGRDLTSLMRQYPRNIWQTRPPGGKARNWIILSEPIEAQTKPCDSVTEA